MKKTNENKNPAYQLSSQEYGQAWKLTGTFEIADMKIPTFSEIDSNAQKLKQLRNHKRRFITSNLKDHEEQVIAVSNSYLTLLNI